ncbi:MAG: hypothetical protein ACOYXA_02985 [Bacteroidota bacterium]
MARWILSAITACFSMALQAQTIRWHPGVVVGFNGAVYTGDLSLQAHDVLLFREKENTLKVLTPVHVQSFRYYDAHADINRHFVAYVASEGPVSRHLFYETVIHGPIGVWRLCVGPLPDMSETAPEYFRYYLYFNQQLLPFQRFYKDVFPVVKAFGPGPKEAVNPHRKADALLWIRWYNQHYTNALAAGLEGSSTPALRNLRSK